MNLIINPSQPPGYTRPINNGSTRFVLPIPGRSRLKPELEKTVNSLSCKPDYSPDESTLPIATDYAQFN